MTPEPCPTCKGKCCCRVENGLPIPHSVAILYIRHVCPDCDDGTYAICSDSEPFVRERSFEDGGPKDVVQIQHGPRGVGGSTPGVFDDDLLAIVEDRLVGFQSGPFACAENGYALTAVREARVWLGKRVARRIERGEHRREEKNE